MSLTREARNSVENASDILEGCRTRCFLCEPSADAELTSACRSIQDVRTMSADNSAEGGPKLKLSREARCSVKNANDI